MHARRLAIVRDDQDVAEDRNALRVAFASSDRKSVDQHFGSATSFVIYTISDRGSRFEEAVEFAPEAQDGNEGKLAARIGALAGCNAVYVQAIGASAIGQLQRSGVYAQKAERGTPVSLLIATLQGQLASVPPAWISKALAEKKSADRFDEMDEEGWDE